MDVMGINPSKSSNIDEGLQMLLSCIRMLAQDVLGRVISEAPSHLPNLKEEVLKKVAEACEDHSFEKGSISDVARKHGLAFPYLTS